jgi:serpin B
MFLNTAKNSFQAPTAVLDFTSPKAVVRINDWVRDNTRGKIDGIVNRIEPDDVLLIVNAVYFHGEWEQAFDVKSTRDMDFTLLDGTKRLCPMMKRHEKVLYFETPEVQIVELPYTGKTVAFRVVLPAKGSTLTDVVAGLNGDVWREWTQKLEPREGTLYLPRFEMSFDETLNEALKTLGVRQAFGRAADFSAMADGELFISEVRHKSRIEVNEKGTEAAATTSVRMSRSAVSVRGFVVTVDRPFLYAIQDRATGVILFLGAITNPNPA